VILEAAGRDELDDSVEPDAHCGHCGANGGCTDGGCGSAGAEASHGACSQCAVKDLVAHRRRAPVH
jgi:hypothetical protein